MILFCLLFSGLVSSLVTAISILTQKMLRILQRKLRVWDRSVGVTRDWVRARWEELRTRATGARRVEVVEEVEEVEMTNRGHEE